MKFNYVTTKIPYLAALTLLFSLVSCGSYQYVGHDNDGIYGSDTRTVEYQTENQVAQTSDNNYYKNYFKEKSQDFEMMTQNGEVFTDIDSYQGEYQENVIDTLQYENAYAGWGQNNDDITINVYNNGFNYWGYRPFYRSYWNYGWGYAGFYDPFWYPNYYGAWFYSPFYYGYNYYGYPFAYGYGYPYYNNYYYNGIYGRRSYAYNNTRRGSLLNRNALTSSRLNSTRNRTTRSNNSTTTRPRSTSTSPRSTTTRPRTTTTRPRTTTSPRTTTPRSSTTRPRTSTPRSSTPRTYSPRSSSPRSSSGTIGRSSSGRSSSGSRGSSYGGGRRR